jgi:hypothetical protein
MQVADEPTETTPSRVDAQPVRVAENAATAAAAKRPRRAVWVASGSVIVATAIGLSFALLPMSTPGHAERSARGRGETPPRRALKQVRVLADAPIKSVRVGDDDPIVNPQPDRRLRLPLVDSRQARSVTVLAVDGRERVATLAPGADTLEVRFPRSALALQPRVRPATKPKTKPVPFATTPYKNK